MRSTFLQRLRGRAIRPTPLPTVISTTSSSTLAASSGWGITGATFVLALLAAGAWLDDDSYLTELRVQEHAAYIEGRISAIEEGRDGVVQAWAAGVAHGRAQASAELGCSMVQAPAASSAGRP